jgi:hypothetical protein
MPTMTLSISEDSFVQQNAFLFDGLHIQQQLVMHLFILKYIPTLLPININ